MCYDRDKLRCKGTEKWGGQECMILKKGQGEMKEGGGGGCY